MRPFCLKELALPDYTPERLEKIFQSGLLPPHYLASQPSEALSGYITDYLKEEIAAEAASRNLRAFSLFLKVAGMTSCELLSYENLSREVGVSAKVIRSYFEILEDTLLGSRLAAYRSSPSRRMALADKFYLFDVGVANTLARRRPAFGTPEFGKSLEHLVWMELQAYRAYCDRDLELSFWRTSTGLEVDFILNNKEVAIEVKSGRVHTTDCKSLAAIAADGPVAQRTVVCLESQSRTIEDKHGPIQILSIRDFLSWLWSRPASFAL